MIGPGINGDDASTGGIAKLYLYRYLIRCVAGDVAVCATRNSAGASDLGSRAVPRLPSSPNSAPGNALCLSAEMGSEARSMVRIQGEKTGFIGNYIDSIGNARH